MKKTTKKQETEQETQPKTQKVPTRAEKKDAVKSLAKEILKNGNFKSNELIEEVAKVYSEKFKSEETENPNDVKGRVGSVLDVMKKEGEVLFEKGVYSLKTEEQKAELVVEKPQETVEEKKEEKPVKTRAKRVKKEEPVLETSVENTEVKEEKRAPKRAKKTENKAEELPKKEEVKEKAPAKKRAKKTETVQETVAETKEEIVVIKQEKAEEIVEKSEEKPQEILKKKPQEKSPQSTLMDMSFLLGTKAVKTESKAKPTESKAEEKQEEKQSQEQANTEQKIEQKVEKKPEQKIEKSVVQRKPQLQNKMKTVRPKSAEEKLQEAFLNRLHRLGGEYFEYYSVYLLEKYSRKNGRRLETLKISAGERDGGIDGEIELTDKLGFRETIYIQSKNWDPSKGDEKLWVVGETLLQQFIGACVCRQAKDGKQHCRGIFITTSRFTPEAKRILNDTQDKFIGYDGADLYETAKECEFGIVKKNGEYVLDEKILSGMKAFYSMD